LRYWGRLPKMKNRGEFGNKYCIFLFYSLEVLEILLYIESLKPLYQFIILLFILIK
jgi:hypothetical protein